MSRIFTACRRSKNHRKSALPGHPGSVSSVFRKKAGRILICLLLSSWIPNFTIAQKSGSFTSNSPRGFIENKGQIVDQDHNPNPDVRYLLHTPGMNVQLRRGGWSYDLFAPKSPEGGFFSPFRGSGGKPELWGELKFHRIDFNLVGCNLNCEVISSEPSADYLNYYTAGTPDEGVILVRSYVSVIYKEIYPKVDLEFLVDEKNGLKYNFVIHPGGNIDNIRLLINGTEIFQDDSGHLIFNTNLGIIKEEVPRSYSLFDGAITELSVCFHTIEPLTYGFHVRESIDDRSVVIIDPRPVRLWGTYYGDTEGEEGSGCCQDSAGNVFLSGRTFSLNNIATTGAHQTTYTVNGDGFLVKFNSTGQREWGTYYGGYGSELWIYPATDPTGNIYITGGTNSGTYISTAGSFQPVKAFNFDAFLVKFNTQGQRLWGTYYGGSGEDNYEWVACTTRPFIIIDKQFNIYFGGTTTSPDNIATPGSHQSIIGGSIDGFLAKFDSSGQRIWGTYYGGSEIDNIIGCAVLNSTIFISGHTKSTDGISTAGSYQPQLEGDIDAFLVKLDTAGQRVWGTYYGGSLVDKAIGRCAVDTNGNVYFAGVTFSANRISSPGSFQPVIGGYDDGFLAKFTSSGDRLWGTYYGGSLRDSVLDCAVNDSGYIFICGSASSQTNIASNNGFKPEITGGSDAFLAKFDQQGQRIWGTYYGGSQPEQAYDCSIGPCDDIYICGDTYSSDSIATPGAFLTTYMNGYGGPNAFLVKFSDCFMPDTAGLVSGPDSVCRNSPDIMYSVADIPSATGYSWTLPSGITINSGQNTNTIYATIGPSAISGDISVYGMNCCGNGVPSFLPVSVFPRPSPAISGNDTVCNGTSTIYSTESGKLQYQWNISPGGMIIDGGGMSDPSVTIIWNIPGSQWIQVNYSDSSGCDALSPTQLDIRVETGDTVEVTITATGDTICAGTLVTLTASSGNAGTNPLFQWFINGVDTNYSDSIFTYVPVQTDTIYCLVTSFEPCRTNNPATSNSLIIQVLPNLPVSISVTPSSNPVCESESVTYTGAAVNKGSTPVYQWFVNDSPVGTNDSVYTYIPIPSDQVWCQLTSNEQCTSNNPAASDTITMMINPVLPVGITISVSANPICEGSPVTFTATTVNGGTTPVYQWQVNGSNAGMNNAVFTYIPENGDAVSCTLTSSELCTSGNPASSYPVIITVVEAPKVTFTPCFDTITATNAKPIRLRGGIPLGGTFTGPGVTAQSGGGGGGSGMMYYFNASIAGPGLHEITYNYINEAGCEDSSSSFVFNFQFSIFNCGDSLLDIRDNQKYPTVLIGTQCWMSSNLNHGTMISGNSPQRDNCIPEKYCFNDIPELCALSSVPCALCSALYQWDEVMTYTDSEEAQGLCPPGWHVPSETDWNQLFAVFLGNGFAGSPLLYSGYSGFNAQLSGIDAFNQSWQFDGFATLFWSSTSHGPWKAWAHGMNDYNYSVSYYPGYRANAFSVRCIMD